MPYFAAQNMTIQLYIIAVEKLELYAEEELSRQSDPGSDLSKARHCSCSAKANAFQISTYEL